LRFPLLSRWLSRVSSFVLVSLCVFALPIGLESQGSSPLQLRYHLRLLRPTTQLMEVEITAEQVTTPALDFMMPAWAPGRYAIYDFAKNVQEFSASGLQGQPLAWTKLDKQTWRVEAHDGANKPISTVQVHYRIFANDLSGSFSQFDSSHANVNGASIFMYIAGHKRDLLSLSVETPPAWKIISGFAPSTEQRTFEVPNYDLLADTPMEISTECSLDEFREGGKTFRVAVHSYPEPTGDRSKLVEGLKKIVRSEMAMMPAPDFDHYTFIFHFAPDIPLGDGMEHFNSTQVVVRGSLDADGLAEAQETAAHEFFHVWNVKRLRPAALGPFDYSRENYTPSLWFAEGVTSYYAYLHLLRAGIWTRQQFLKRLAQEIRDLEAEPGRAWVSAESSSFNAWFYDRSPQMQETNFANSTISYYNKGLLLGLLLDLEIRSRTSGQKSLDDVLRSMYRKFYESPAARPDPAATSDYGPGRGYEEKDILEALSQVSGNDFKPFFIRYTQQSDPLPYASTLALAGLELRVGVAAGSAPSLGVLTQRVDQGLRIVAVRPGGAADRGGLSRDDTLTEVDNLSLLGEELDDRLKIYPPGAEVPFTVLRHGREERITVALDPPARNAYSIEELPEATPAQVTIRDGWLGK
jgi:predicted metalloprotease with PDZ domain